MVFSLQEISADFHGLPVGHTRRTKSAKFLGFFVFTHYHWPYPLVNSYITIEHHHLVRGFTH
jgi:hypothetical protein